MDFGHSLHKIRDRHLARSGLVVSQRQSGKLGCWWTWVVMVPKWLKEGARMNVFAMSKIKTFQLLDGSYPHGNQLQITTHYDWGNCPWTRNMCFLAHGPVAGDTTPGLGHQRLSRKSDIKMHARCQKGVSRLLLGYGLVIPKSNAQETLFEISPGGPVCGFSAYRVVFIAMNLTNDELRSYCEKAWNR